MASKTEYQLMLKLGANTSSSWNKTLGKAEAALSELDSYSSKIMKGIAAGVTAAAGAAAVAISSSVEVYSGFESEMATVQSISGATAQQFLEMKDAAMDAGRSTVFSATESASALEYMSLAGWNTEESIAGLQPILKLAAATGKELQTTSDLVTDSMSALGLEVADLDMYLDKLVQGNNKANNTAEQLMEGLVEVGGAARTLGADLDDTITALGVLANNGTKGTEAGNALNAMMVRLAGNTTALKELGKLKVDIWDDNGEFVGFEEALIRIDDALSGLTDEARTMSLKNIAGTHYYSQMSYLLDAVKEATDENGNVVAAWQELETQVSDSSGALKTMYDITTDTLLFAQKRLTSAKEDMQIRVTDVFADDSKDFLMWLSEKMPQATDSIVDFAETHSGVFSDALEGVEEGIEWLWENGIAAGEWIIKHKSAIIGGLKGVATSFVAIKAALAGVKIVELFTNPLSAIPAAAAIAVAGIGAVAGAIRDAETAAVNANLADHFGSISLSMSEIEAAAQGIVSSNSLTGVLDALEAFDDLDSFSEKMDDAVQTLDKLNWKISIGLELTEGEEEEYQKAIADFAANAQEYALQAQYSVALVMDFAFDENDLEQSNLVSKVNQFYADQRQELVRLSTELNEAMTDAFNDGLLEPDKIETIARIQRDMAEIEKSLAVGDYQAELAMLEMEYSGENLTAESFLSLAGQLDENNMELIDAYKSRYARKYSATTASHEGGAITDEEYQTLLQDANDELARLTADTQMQSMQFLLNTINSTYEDEIRQYQEAAEQALEKWGDPVYDWQWASNPGLMFETVMGDIAENGPDETSRKAIAELLEPMEDSIGEMYAMRDQLWDILTPEMQQTLDEILAEYDQLYGMTVYKKAFGYGGDTEGLVNDFINRAEASAQYANVAEYAARYVNPLDDDLAEYTTTAVETSLTESMESAKTETVEPVIEEMYAYSQEYLDQIFAKGLHTAIAFELEAHSRLNYLKSGETEIMSNAAGGIYSKPILTTFAEEGPEAAVPLDGSARAKSIWTRAGQILGMLPQEAGNRDQALLAGLSVGRQESRTEGNIQVSFSPTITIQGNASKDDVHGALTMTLEELREMLMEIKREDQRVSFG
ncbi:MAG: phage tail tape measure protein [Candidatus Gastranaerophilales bacterium]|nr:phage tail tape measure protein [Candidatus Gastranaerophilales bacterium]